MIIIVDKFLEMEGNAVSDATKRNYRSDLKTLAKFYNKNNIKYDNINDEEVLKYNNWLAEKYKDTTHKRKLQTTIKFYDYLVNIGKVNQNNFKNIRLPKTKTRVPKYLKLEDAQKLVKVSRKLSDDKLINQRNELIVLMLLHLGLRVGELENIRIGDIDGNIINIRDTKNGIDRIAVLSPKLHQKVLKYMENRPKSPNIRLIGISIRQIQRVVIAGLRKAGLKGYTTHDLRHTAATLMLKGGADIREIQVILGHKNINTTQIYTHVDSENQGKVANMMADIL